MKVDLIKNRVNDLVTAEGDIVKGLVDIEAQRRTLEDDLHAIRVERYELTEAAAPGPLFYFLPMRKRASALKRNT